MAKKTSNEGDLKVDILKPFGPWILYTKIPNETIKMLNRECDSIIKDEQKRKSADASKSLVGHVTEELEIDLQSKPKLKDFGLLLGDLTKCLLDEHNKLKNNRIALDDMGPPKFYIHNTWFVRSFDADYNPVHIHTSGQFTCVLYLKVPKGIGIKNTRNKNEPYTTEGYIDFVYGSTNLLSSGSYSVMPVVGDLYIFPAYLFHTVYPFFGKGERRSLSANFTLELNNKATRI